MANFISTASLVIMCVAVHAVAVGSAYSAGRTQRADGCL